LEDCEAKMSYRINASGEVKSEDYDKIDEKSNDEAGLQA
jgi:hypothetical protein